MTTNRDEIKAKIAKLMALGNDERANEFEAEAALRQAAFLMRKHAIEQAEIATATGRATEWDWYSVHVPANPQAPATSAITWYGALGLAIAKFTDARAAWTRLPVHGYCIKFCGDATDVHYAVWLAKHLRDTVRRESANFAGGRKERETFRLAMVDRISERMKTIREESRQEMRASASSALVVIDQKIAAINSQFGQQKARSGAARQSDAFSDDAGRSAGDRVGFGRPVDHHTSPARALSAGV